MNQRRGITRYCPLCNHDDVKKVGVRNPLYWCQRCGKPSLQPKYISQLMHELRLRKEAV